MEECPVLLGEVGGEDGHEGDIESYKEAVKDWLSVQLGGSSEPTRQLMPEMRGDLRGRLQGSPSNRVLIEASDSDDEIVVDVSECGAVRYKDEYYKKVRLHLQKIFPEAEVDSDGEIDLSWDDYYSEDDLSPTKKSVKDITPERLERELARGLTPDRVWAVLRSVKFTTQNRPNISDGTIYGFNLGITSARGDGIVVSNPTLERPVLTKLLVHFAMQNIPQSRLGFKFTSIQVNKDVPCNLHVDRNNLGPSYIVGVGNYRPHEKQKFGGCVWIDGCGPADIHDTWVEFDGNIPHATVTPYWGERYSIVYFTTGNYEKLGDIVRERIKNGQKKKKKDCKGGLPENTARMIDEWNFPYPVPGEIKKGVYEPVADRMERGQINFDAFRSATDYSEPLPESVPKPESELPVQMTMEQFAVVLEQRLHDKLSGKPIDPRILQLDLCNLDRRADKTSIFVITEILLMEDKKDLLFKLAIMRCGPNNPEGYSKLMEIIESSYN
eukprot:SAG11_NODE_3795_length_2220_cov_237.444130_1_plen_495_part_10